MSQGSCQPYAAPLTVSPFLRRGNWDRWSLSMFGLDPKSRVKRRIQYLWKSNLPAAYQKMNQQYRIERLCLSWEPPLPTVSIPFAYRVWRLLILHSMSRWPAEYCSMTSFTSYGRNVSLNFRLATWNFIILFKHTLDIIPNNFIKINYQYAYQQISNS